METKKIGIIGGYSNIGQYCVKDIIDHTNYQVIIAGRSLEKALAEAKKYPLRAQGCKTDLMHEAELNKLCSECNLIINCAGPSTIILDRIAKICLNNNTHYIDVGGYDILYDKLLPIDEEIKKKGLLFLLNAGMTPGISGVLPIYVADLAEKEGMKVKNIYIYTTGKEKWSYGSCRDMVWSMFEEFQGFFKNGKWTSQSIFFHSKKVKLKYTSKKQFVYPIFNNQLKDFAIERAYPLVAEYVGSEEFGIKSTLISLYIRFFMKHKKDKAAAYFQKALNQDMEGLHPFGMISVILEDKNENKVEASLHTTNNFFLTGIASSLAAIQLLDEMIKIKTGVHYMCNVVDTFLYVDSLKNRKVNLEIE